MRCQTSFSELANVCLGPVSGIILNMLLVFAVFGIMALYMILFSEIAISLIGPKDDPEAFLSNKAFYVIFLGILISPFIIKKKIQEMKFATYVLFFGVISLIVMLTFLLIFRGSYDSRVASGEIEAAPAASADTDVAEGDMTEKLVDSLNIAVASQGFVIALFPIYQSMARESRPKIMSSVTMGLIFTCTVYTYLSYISMAYFGHDNIEPSIFKNIQQEDGVHSILLRCVFIMIFFCNIPFIFFAGKLAIIAIVH